ncbi:MAG: NlpC/P60 family protein [Pseudomonadota bacterium]
MNQNTADRRVLASNGVYAAAELRGRVEAEYFVKGEISRVAVPVADLHVDPKAERLDRQLLYGDRFRVLQQSDGYSFGQAERGAYVGYLRSSDLTSWNEPNSKVDAKSTLGFREPDFKSANPMRIPMGASLHVTKHDERFAETDLGLYVPTPHLVRIDQFANDPIEIAQQFLGTPYLWGGNSDLGLDCSGLVQAACLACGIDCPGDSDQQQAELGILLPQEAALQKADLLFWKGHVAWVSDSETILHANAHHMAVVYEPLTEAIERIEAQGDGPVTARKRLELPA